MQLLVIEPLLVCEPAELEKRFTEVFGRFYGLYLSGTLLIMATLREDFAHFASIAPHRFEACEETVRRSIGISLTNDAGLAVLRGLATMQRVVRGVFRTITAPSVAFEAGDVRMTELANWTVAYIQALAGVLWAVNGRVSIPIRRENVVQLAQWGANYANGCYAMAREFGLLRPASPRGPLPDSDPEDAEFANAGLDHYAELVSAEESE